MPVCAVAEASRSHIKTLCLNESQDLKIVRVFGTVNDVFTQLRNVRGGTDSSPCEFDFDSYSYHYGLFVNDQAVGTMTVTRAADGIIDCEDLYPGDAIQRYRQVLASPCKFRINSGMHSTLRTLRLMLREAWRDQLTHGTRVVVINAEKLLVRFYNRMGFDVIDNSQFVHPLLGTNSICMSMRADPETDNHFADLFATVDTPIDREHWVDACKQTSPVECLVSSNSTADLASF
ncbi:N-acyl amino acid synthase FeeM domain-containing protein [Neorhodopirellula lusitana]|uniref:N-acyl amino acid synthase FeeM domain-containing protein n=1 Tax=Neorhodopirellula lusitana TaxID=445327 RepID=UPI00384D995E